MGIRHLYHVISMIIPEGHFKERLKDTAFSLLNSFTFGTKEVVYGEKGEITGKFYKLPLIHYTDCLEDGAFEGYIKEYTIKKGDIVIDAGAFHGTFTVYAAKLAGDEGLVIAFEPDKSNYKVLEKNIQLNGLKNVICVNKGLWDNHDTLKFKSQGGTSKLSVFDNEEAYSREVMVIKLDDFLKEQNITKINFVKMDVEGAELKAIEGMKEVIKNNKIHFAIASYHIVDNRKTDKRIEEFFKQNNYSSFTSNKQHLTTYASHEPKK